MMNNLTFAEQVLTDEVVNSAIDHHRPIVRMDAEQGVFTQSTINELLAKALLPGHQNMSDHIFALVGLLEDGGQIAAIPPAFTPDELAQMQIILNHHEYNGLHGNNNVVELVMAAEHVGFWSQQQLSELQSQELHIESAAQNAIDALVFDLISGAQVIGIVN